MKKTQTSPGNCDSGLSCLSMCKPTCDWVTTQQEDLILTTMIKWISSWKVQDIKHLLGDVTNTEEGKTILQEQKKLTLYQGAFYHCHTLTGKLEEVLQFLVPMAHWVAAMNGCHQDAQHQSQQWMLYLLHDWFWWPKPQCDPSLLLHLWSCYTLILPALRQWWSWINPKTWWTFWSLWPIYETHYGICDPQINLQKLLLSFCSKDISWSLEHQPSSWVTEEPTLKAMSSESFASLWAYGRLGLHLTMLKPMDRWNEFTKHWGTWQGN